MNTLSPEEDILDAARFRAAGDLMVHQKQLDIALQPDGSYDFHPQYAEVSGLLGNADYTIANLETTVGRVGEQEYSGYPRFNTPEELLDALHDAGVNFLTLANNHILDRDYEGMIATADNVEARGFDFGGVSRTPQEKEKPVIVEVRGIRAGFLCFTDTMNRDISCETEEEAKTRAAAYGVKTLINTDFGKEVKKLRDAGAEVVFALPHWGEEYRRKPGADTVEYAKKLIAAGVDVVLGSHSHMVQSVEFLAVETGEGKTRRGLVAYSLGNFISNQSDRYTDSGIVLDFTVRRRREGISIEDVRVLPTYCWRRDHMIQPLCSKKYLNTAPAGMDEDTLLRLRESYEELRELIDKDIPFLIS